MTPGAAGTASYHYRGETVAQDEIDVVARLASALRYHMTDRDETSGCALRCGYDGDDRTEHLATALLPIVRTLRTKTAAKEAEQWADAILNSGFENLVAREMEKQLRNRAATLRGEAGR